MKFNSIFFFLTFFFFLVSWFVMARGASDRTRKFLILAYSYFFYGMWSPAFVLLMVGTTTVDYWTARLMVSHPARRRLWLVISVATGLSALLYFKYLNFFLSGFNLVGRLAGHDPGWFVNDIVLPAGISFYTFESISYTVDVYRRKIAPTRSLLDYSIFVAFFPKLVAGPIIRAGDLLPQLARLPSPSAADVRWGVSSVVFGLVLKCVLADTFGEVVNRIFDGTANGIAENWGAGFLFGVQIFCDFAGYSTVALGLARILGFSLPRNFDSPYASVGFSDFWRRWHMSLSSWVRDYLYIPFGGSSGGLGRTSVNLVVTMAICGLWHGANLTFVVWGGLHGVLLAIEHSFRRLRRTHAGFGFLEGRDADATTFRLTPATLVAMAFTWACASFLWVFFRATSLEQATTIFSGFFSGPWSAGKIPPGIWVTTVLVTLAHVAQRRWNVLGRIRDDDVLLALALSISVLAVAFYSSESQEFIYFQF